MKYSSRYGSFYYLSKQNVKADKIGIMIIFPFIVVYNEK